jgi:uncharacterized protein
MTTNVRASRSADWDGRDFPFYREITPGQWLIALVFCAAGFAALMLPTFTGNSSVSLRWASVLLFTGLPLLGLRMIAGQSWITLLTLPTARGILVGLAVVPLVIITSFCAAYVVSSFTTTSPNPVGAMISAMTPLEVAAFLASTLPQLFGEELVTIIPFLAILSICHAWLGMSRRSALLIAWVVSAVIFGALHLPTYDWHVIQAVGIIGVARLALTLAYTISKNIWVSTITHVVNDWMLFAAPFMFSSPTG